MQYAAIDLTSYFSTLSKKVPLLKEGIKSIREIEYYFGKIQDINYKSIYSIKVVAELPSDKNIIDFVQKIIKAIKIVKPENIKHDLLGRLFHELLPFKTRKILAAFYTNPIAAELLAGLSIDKWDEKVMDTACGFRTLYISNLHSLLVSLAIAGSVACETGTLLVSAYRRKFDLYKQIQKLDPRNIEKMHKKFVEEDLTGSDLMPFASHLTAVNLCAQTIKVTTNFLRIAVFDSLDFSKYPNINSGIPVNTFNKTIQSTLFKSAINNNELNELKGAVNSNGKGESFKIYRVDTLIMNPPFTDREKMPSDYREKLKEYSKLIPRCGGQVNLWGYFLALADDLVKNNGKIGAVIPINIFRGSATEKIRNFILENYKIRYIVKTTKELGFSEDSAFRDVLLILEKTNPQSEDLTGIILLKKSLKEFTIVDSKNLVNKILAIPKGEQVNRDEDIEVYWIDYKELLKFKDNLMPKIGFAQTRDVLDGFLNLVFFNLTNNLFW
ncbi:MAG: Eco57I restriction-modification methylase domain-containing protein, partial [Methanosarcinales archaeon]